MRLKEEEYDADLLETCSDILDAKTPVYDIGFWVHHLDPDTYIDLLAIPDEDLVSDDPATSPHNASPFLPSLPPFEWDTPYPEPVDEGLYYKLSAWDAHESQHQNRAYFDYLEEKPQEIVAAASAAPPTFPCPLCTKTFSTQEALRTHATLHANGDQYGRYLCPHCDFVYKSISQLTRHYKRCHSEHLYNCHMCTQIFVAFDAYDEHVTRQACQVFRCRACGVAFARGAAYKQHVRGHRAVAKVRRAHVVKVEPSRSGMLKCEVCELGCENRARLVRHVRLKHSPCRFSCGLCGKQFVRPDHYQIHMRRHYKQKPCVCDFCGKRFCQKSDLNRHRKFVHLGSVRKSAVKVEP